MLFRLRVSLPDRPGSLHALTRALADAGANIVDIEVLGAVDDRALDDLVISTPTLSEGQVEGMLSAIPGLAVLSMRRTVQMHGARPDLDLLAKVAGEPTSAVARFVELAPSAFNADWSVAVVGHPPTAVAQTVAAPREVETLPRVIGTSARRCLLRRGDAEPWEIASVRVADSAVHVVRRGGPMYLQAELLRLHKVAALTNALAVAPGGGTTASGA
jgi:hypothetical protein